MSQQPLVSVVMNCYNGEAFLREAVDSVYSQTYKNWEIVFWDNASEDATANIAGSYDEKLKYFCSEETVPLYAARNMAIKKCKGEFVAFLDCDDVWFPEKLEIQMDNTMEGRVVVGGYDVIDGEGRIVGNSVVFPPVNMGTNRLFRCNDISMSCVLMPMQIFDKYKFNSKFNLMGDFDLWIRLSFKYQFYGVQRLLQHSRRHEKNTSLLMEDKWSSERREFYLPLINFQRLIMSPWFLVYVIKNESRILLAGCLSMIKKVF